MPASEISWITGVASTAGPEAVVRTASPSWDRGMRTDEVVRRAAELGRASSGVVTAPELRRAGVDLSVVARLVRRGQWTRLWRGTYLTAAHAPGPLALAHGAVKHVAAAPGRTRSNAAPVVTGLAGAAALGLRWVPPVDRVQVLVDRDVQRRSTDRVLVRRAHDLSGVATWSWGGVAVAEAARLVVDGARECRTLRDVRGLVLGAVADGYAAPADLLALLDAGATGGTAWCRRATRDAQRGAASPPEAELVDGLVGRGRPFYVNADVHVLGRFVGRFDVYLVGTGVGGEMDSKERHGDADLLDDTLLRHERAGAHGLTLVHVTPSRYRADPAAFAARLLAAVADRERRGIPEPAGLVVTARGPLLS